MKTCLSTLALSAALVASAANAGQLVDVAVIDRDNGTTLPFYYSSGKSYVAGAPGHRYSIRLTNRTGQRIMTVLSVDGVNAVTGETANPNQSGYVLDPYESTEIAGWRKSMDEIAQFNFTTLGDSYAGRTGRPNNVGVIGVAVFRERVLAYQWRKEDKIARESDERQNNLADSASEPAAAPPAPASQPVPSGSIDRYAQTESQSAPADKSAMAGGSRAKSSGGMSEMQPERELAKRKDSPLGTGHGAREISHVENTQFERANSRPNEVVSIYYDSYRNLVARGVIYVPRPRSSDPQPFPNQFVPDPYSRANVN